MTECAKCKFENPPGSKFCAGCGAKIPENPRCASCGTESPAGSKFCKKCGKPLGASAPSPPRGSSSLLGNIWTSLGGGTGGAAKGKALSESLSKVKGVLWGSVGICAFSLFINYSSISRIKAYMGPFADTSTSWFLIILDIGLIALSAYAVTKLDRGDLKLVKVALLVNAVVGGITTLLYFKAGIISILSNGGLLALNVWGRMLISKEERPLV